MAEFWIALGTVVLVAGLADLFLASLNYDEAGFIATPLGALQWRGLRRVTRRLPRSWRPIALRQVTGLQISQSLLTWLLLVVVGYGLVYYGLMSGHNFQYDGHGLHDGIYSAFYLSAAQLATVGTSQVTPETDALRTLTILDTLTGLVLVTLALTFLINVYQVVRDLSTLSSTLYDVDVGGSDAVASLAPYFPQGRATGIDSHLDALNDAFSSYIDGVRLHHVAYYFQSGRDHFSLPYALDMLSGVVAALRWGLPSVHPAAQEPTLTVLTLRFDRFAAYLHDQLRWRSTAVPETVDFETFERSYTADGPAKDLWLGRFLTMNQAMKELAQLDSEDPRAAYARYRQWLPFAFRAYQLVGAVSRDLDYQPIRRPRDQRPDGSEFWTDRETGRDSSARHAVKRLISLAHRRMVAADPGLSRVLSGTRALLAAAASVGTMYLILTRAGVGATALPAAMLGGMVGMQATVMARDRAQSERKVTVVLMVAPAIVGASIGAAADPSQAAAIGALVGVVLIGVWVRRFGSRFAALGQLFFMACYFSLLLHFPVDHLAWLVLAAAVGTAWAYLARFVIVPERPAKMLRTGVSSFYFRVAALLDPLIDAVSAGRWEPDLVHQVRTDLRQLRRCGSFLEGELRAAEPATVGGAHPASDLRLRLFDAELAAGNLVATARRVAGASTRVPRVLRAEMAGLLELTQVELNHLRSATTATAGSPDAPWSSAGTLWVVPPHWPAPARRLSAAASELLDALATTQSETQATAASPAASATEVTADAAAPIPQRGVSQRWNALGGVAPTSRQAIQAAVATGLALLAGAAISPDRQYWAAIAAFVVFSGTETAGETIVKGIERMIGTLLGAIVGFAVAAFTGGDPAVVLPLVALCVFAAMYSLSTSYTQMVFWVTMMIALLYEYLGKLSAEALELRVLETVVGAVIALAIATFVMPTRTGQKVRADLLAVLHVLDGIIQGCLSAVGGGPGRADLNQQALELDQRLHRLYISIAPLRRAGDALRRDGLERRLTVLWALTYYTRHLIGAVSRSATGDAGDLPPEIVDRLAAISRDNMFALARVAKGEGPGETGDVEGILAFSDGSGKNEDLMRQSVVRDIVRINQSVVTLIDDLSGGREVTQTGA